MILALRYDRPAPHQDLRDGIGRHLDLVSILDDAFIGGRISIGKRHIDPAVGEHRAHVGRRRRKRKPVRLVLRIAQRGFCAAIDKTDQPAVRIQERRAFIAGL